MATRPAWVNDELFPFESRFADVGGAQVHYIDEGEGPVFLCLHGPAEPAAAVTRWWNAIQPRPRSADVTGRRRSDAP